MAIHIKGARIGPMTLVLAFLSSMGGFLFGYDTGQISDILLMQDFLQRFAQYNPATGEHKFSTTREGLIVSMLSIGTLIGALLGRYFSDWMGRRRAITVFSGVLIVGIIVQITAFTAWYQVMIGRIIAGLGVGSLSAAVPVYQAETVPRQLRGTLIATYQLMITFGILMAYCFCIGTRRLNSAASWRIPVALGIVFATFLGVGILFMPESPRWLVKRGRHDKAVASIARVHGSPIDNPAVQAEYQEILIDFEKEKQVGGGSWLECFVGYKGGHKTVYRTFLLMTLQMFQQLTGANYFFYYGATIFTSVGISDSFVTQIILGAVNFVCTFLGLWILERFGRRWPLIIGGLWQSAWLFAFAGVGVTQDTSTQKTGSFMIAAACMFILGFASTWGPGLWILTGESFHMRNRARQAALATASNWTWNFLLAYFTPLITAQINFAYGFVFAGCNLVAALIVFFFLYESSGISLEQVNAMYGAPGLKPWQSRKWAPPGYATREEAEREAEQKAKAASVEDLVGPRGLSQDSQQTALDGSHGLDGHGKEGKVQEVAHQEKPTPA